MAATPPSSPKRRRLSWKNLLVFMVSLVLALAAGEWVYRRLLFSDNPAYEAMRQPKLYAHEGSLEYWMLRHRFTHGEGIPNHPHPWMGWLRANVNFNSYLHDDFLQARGRRPVLLYGDSFAECMPEVTCFETVLNQDTLFNRSHIFLNYGVGGYGVDQIHLMMRQTAHRYERPFVVFSLLTYDIDRTGLPLRIGLKPYYQLEGDSLALKGVPIAGTADSFVQATPVPIFSYLSRRMAYSPALGWLPTPVLSRLQGTNGFYDDRRALNLAVLDSSLAELRRLDCDFVFFIFQNNGFTDFVETGDAWHLELLQNWLDKNQVPHIWSADVLRADVQSTGRPYEDYILKSNGHPTALANEIMAKAMRDAALSKPWHPSHEPAQPPAPSSYAFMIDQEIHAMEADSAWSASVAKQAAENNVTLEEMKLRNAIYTINKRTMPFRW